MIETKEVPPTLVKLHLDDLNIILDGLYALHREIRRNPTYTIPEKLYAHSQTQNILETLTNLYTLITGEDHQAVPRYHVVPAGTTVTR